MAGQQMNNPIIYQGREAGLGVIITQLSFLLACDRPVEYWVSNGNNLAAEIKRIWQIPDDRLSIRIGINPQGIPNIESDELCVYVDYFYSETLCLDQITPIKKSRKKCVAVCMHHGNGLREDVTVRGMPYNKFATARQYEILFTLLDCAGYDIITMNSSSMDLKTKVYLLNEMCDCVIGYEGGLHHLAHVLKIPSIILPWKFCDNGDPPIPPGIYFEPHRYHPDRRTWFVMQDADQDILTWSPRQLRDKIDQLYTGSGGNNIVFDPLTTFDPETLRIRHPQRDLTPRLHPPDFDLIRQLRPRFNVAKVL
jgi:hypothetical protein